MWINNQGNISSVDIHTGYRGSFLLKQKELITFRFSTSANIIIWVDGELFTTGPSRFEKDYPVYEEKELELEAGKHIIAAHCHYAGVETRIMQVMQPFIRINVYDKQSKIFVSWRASRLQGFTSGVRRLGECLGFVEWCDKNLSPTDWNQSDFNDEDWEGIIEDSYTSKNDFKRSVTRPVMLIPKKMEQIASGELAGTYGYEFDDIPARFFLRDLKCDFLPKQGLWRRYDLGHVRLFHPSFVIHAPKGSIIEIAYSEYLVHNRVSPYITLMSSASCNLDHYIAPVGPTKYFPVTPRGGRFVEIHIFCADGQDCNQINIVEEEYLQRCGHDEIDMPFVCSNKLLEKIWFMGAETYRSCAEDVIVDCPVRERGQWVGDNVNVGMNLAAVLYSDISISKKGLYSAAQCVRNDGLIPSNMPGQCGFLASFSLQWVTACIKYYKITGDNEPLNDLFAAAVNNLNVFKKYYKQDKIPLLDYKLMADDGVTNFIDWGYSVDEDADDIASNIYYYKALESIIDWCKIIGENSAEYETLKTETGKILKAFALSNEPENIEYHALILLLDIGFISEEKISRAITTIKCHILNCFPNNQLAPRQSEPRLVLKQIITPYFAHFVFPVLIKHGEFEFVLQQYESCWGWMIKNGFTTCLEVFDTRWSHCHQWSASPTWQISKYILGLYPAFDKGKNVFDFTFVKSNLTFAKGKVPICDGSDEYILIDWKKVDVSTVKYYFECDSIISLIMPDGNMKRYNAGKHEITVTDD